MRNLVFVLVTLFSTLSWAQNFYTAPQSTAKFFAKARPSALNIHGENGKLRGIIQIQNSQVKGKFEVETSTFTTGLGVRDNHLKDKVLKPKEHPKATLVLDPVTLPADWQPGKNLETKFKGNLTIVGQTKPVEGTVKISGPSMAAEVSFDLKLTEFGIEPPSYMGLKVMNEVSVTASIPSFDSKGK